MLSIAIKFGLTLYAQQYYLYRWDTTQLKIIGVV